MKTPDERTRYLTRNNVMNLLSDTEITTVSTAESMQRLEPGAEYLDLEALEAGVQRTSGKDMPMGCVLPRKAVQERTWGKILKALAGASVTEAPSGGLSDSSY